MRLAVTGLGVVSPIGIGRADFTAAIDAPSARDLAFRSEPTLVSKDVAQGVRIAEVWGFDPSAHLGAKGHRNFDRLTKLQIVAAKQALEDANIKREGEFVALEPARIGVCSATAYGSLEEITELQRVAELEDPRYINPTRFPNTVINSAAGYVSIWEDLRAPNTTITDGNTGALDGVLHAAIHLEQKRADAMVVGGGEVITEPLVLAMRRLGLFDSPEFGLGEGSAFVVLERAETAASRGATPLAFVVGFGSAFDAPESEAALVHACDDVVERAVRGALADARLEASSIDLIVSAISGIASFDAAEREALARVFPADIETIEPKRSIGESFGAAGALGIASALARFEHGTARRALVLSVGYYGNVSAVVLEAGNRAVSA